MLNKWLFLLFLREYNHIFLKHKKTFLFFLKRKKFYKQKTLTMGSDKNITKILVFVA